MTALKAAAHNLLTTLKNAEKTPGDIKVSIVPFAVDVNVGTGNVDASWIDWTDWDAAQRHLQQHQLPSKSSCKSHGKTWTPRQPQPPGTAASTTATRTTTCSTRRRVAGSSGDQVPRPPGRRLPGLDDAAVATDWTALNSKIDAMTPTGNTNVTIGLQMALADALAGRAVQRARRRRPTSTRSSSCSTDGTTRRTAGARPNPSIDARTQKVCDNAKADNIKLYTVRVIDGNATLLQELRHQARRCITTSTQASQLNSVFTSIAQNLANLRITK